MKKMPCLFRRDFTDPRVPVLLREVSPGCEWVLEGKGFASVKHDGTACLIRKGRISRRYDYKARHREQGKEPPEGWEPCDPEPDPITGHWPGWVPGAAIRWRPEKVIEQDHGMPRVGTRFLPYVVSGSWSVPLAHKGVRVRLP